MMGGRRLVSLSSMIRIRSADPVPASPLNQLHQLSLFSSSSGQTGKNSVRRRVIPSVLLSLTAGFALGALNDIATFHGCSKKAIEKANENQNVIEVLGTPIVRTWYNTSLTVGRWRKWVSGTFSVSGPQGSGIFQLKAVRSGDDKWWSFMQHNNWDFVAFEVLLDVASSSSSSSPSDTENEKVVRINLLVDNM